MAFSSIIWFAIGIIIMALEIFMPGFIIFWFGAGGVLTSLFVFIGIIPVENGNAQWLFFFLSSLAFLGLWQVVFKKRFQSNVIDPSRDATLQNVRGKALSRITPGIPGEVELYTAFHSIKKWEAESAEIIEAGDEVIVTDANGIKLIVKHI